MEHTEWGVILKMIAQIAVILWQAITAIAAVIATKEVVSIRKQNGNCNDEPGKEVSKNGR